MSGLNLLVFRGDQRRVCGYTLKAALEEQLRLPCGDNPRERLIGALLRAGELECGLADADSAATAPYELLTDRIADALLHSCEAPEFQSNTHSDNCQDLTFQSLLDAARNISDDLPEIERISIAVPEGFAYYALHPLAYADVLDQICGRSGHLLVVGIRSIGTTLSAVLAAAARRQGMKAERFTVRPQGHPYNRTAEFSSRQLTAIQQFISSSSSATFAVVDEGPGLSGSSFLAVAEALERAGAPREKIVLVSSHAPNVDMLCAADAARRWRRFRCVAVAREARRPAEAVDFIGGGKWRSGAFANPLEWPASWTSFERLKYLSSTENNEPRLYKFAGLGHYGDEVFERELKVAAAGFGPLPRRESDGFVSYPWISHQKIGARSLPARDISPETLARMAQYCAFRLRTFRIERAELSALRQMAEHNLHELGLDLQVELRLEHPVIADGRMQPHELLLTKEDRLLKTDSGSHGDDHFFPGPTDIAWDLAGAIVEWRMNEQQARDFIGLYRSASGDDASARIDGFIKAYAVFRSSYCLMAANAMKGSDEESRLQHAANEYKAMVTRTESRSFSAA